MTTVDPWTAHNPAPAPAALVPAGRLRTHHLLIISCCVLGAASVLLAGVAAVVHRARPPLCSALNCVEPPTGPPVEAGVPFSSTTYGWSDRWLPSAATGIPTRAAHAGNLLSLTFSGPGPNRGALYLWANRAPGVSAAQCVEEVAAANLAGAAVDYTLPGVTIGERPGAGTAYTVTPLSADGASGRDEVDVLCAVHGGLAVIALARGPYFPVGSTDGHLSPAHLALALWADPDIEAVRWPGEPTP